MYSFNYQRPSQSAQAVGAAKAGADARFLAGGQSLVQAMKLRLSQPSHLIDLGGIGDLAGITVSATTVSIGAMTRHDTVARSAEVARAGTIGGSLAHSDPAACYPSAILGLGATIRTDRRSIPGDQFFTGLFETALQAGELIVGVDFPIPQQAAYVKFKHPASRFALVGVFVSKSASGVRVGVTGAKSHAFRWTAAETALSGNFTPAALKGLSIDASDINGDLHGSPDYRAAMVATMTARAVAQATGG